MEARNTFSDKLSIAIFIFQILEYFNKKSPNIPIIKTNTSFRITKEIDKPLSMTGVGNSKPKQKTTNPSTTCSPLWMHVCEGRVLKNLTISSHEQDLIKMDQTKPQAARLVWFDYKIKPNQLPYHPLVWMIPRITQFNSITLLKTAEKSFLSDKFRGKSIPNYKVIMNIT